MKCVTGVKEYCEWEEFRPNCSRGQVINNDCFQRFTAKSIHRLIYISLLHVLWSVITLYMTTVSINDNVINIFFLLFLLRSKYTMKPIAATVVASFVNNRSPFTIIPLRYVTSHSCQASLLSSAV